MSKANKRFQEQHTWEQAQQHGLAAAFRPTEQSQNWERSWPWLEQKNYIYSLQLGTEKLYLYPTAWAGCHLWYLHTCIFIAATLMTLKVTLAWNGASTLIKSGGGWNNFAKRILKKKTPGGFRGCNFAAVINHTSQKSIVFSTCLLKIKVVSGN